MSAYQSFKENLINGNPTLSAADIWAMWKSMSPGDKNGWAVERSDVMSGYQKFRLHYKTRDPHMRNSEIWMLWQSMSQRDQSTWN